MHIISTDEDPCLQIESFVVINLRGVSPNKKYYVLSTVITELYCGRSKAIWGDFAHCVESCLKMLKVVYLKTLSTKLEECCVFINNTY